MHSELCEEKKPVNVYKLGELNDRDHQFSLNLMTLSWIATPSSIRELGGALFGSYKYGRAFIFYNGADSYYATRGFRCCLLIK